MNSVISFAFVPTTTNTFLPPAAACFFSDGR